jgi:hypothetical protein
MGSAKKLLEAMARNPRDWTMADVITVARHTGLSISSPGDSHHILRHATGRKISIPAHRPIKPIYIKALLSLILEGRGDDE